ncbi:hypothetical protein yfred0001_12540 [Yersinia frederiksenii ATCC 33641]|nr:hypothetical protein yfred0001_12540 [Yersinia frederiksenii ATCC 33641]
MATLKPWCSLITDWQEPAVPELNPLMNRPHGDVVHVMTNVIGALV